MHLRRWMPAAALAALLALTLAGCTGGAPTPTPSPSAVVTPLFATDEEALKAATEAYAAYLKMSDTISHDGGARPERIKPYVTASVYSSLSKEYASLMAANNRTNGRTTFFLPRIDSHSHSKVSVFLCSDVSEVELVDSQNRPITAVGRHDVLPLQVQFTVNEGQLLLARSEVWAGEDFC